MEGDEYLTKFQGWLLSLSKKGLLNEPPDENQIEEVKKYEIEELSTFIATLPNSAKNKIAYYMILNTELKVSDDLRNDEYIGLFVNLTPPISHQALIKWIIILDLFSEFCKAIENLPSVLSEELVDYAFGANFYFKGIEYHILLWVSMYKKVCKIEKANYLESPAGLMHHFKLFTEVLYMFMENIISEDLPIFSELLKIFLNLVTFYKNPDPDDEMYKLSIKTRMTCDTEVSNEKSINIVLRTLSSFLNPLTFEKWNSSLRVLEEWDTIQNLSSRLLHEIELLEVPAGLSDVLSKLAVKESDVAVQSLILDAKFGEKFNWTRGIISPDVTEQNNCPLHEMNDEDLDLLLHEAFKHLETSGEEMKELFLAAVTLSPNQQKWLKMVFDKYHPDLLTTSNTSKDLVETFNRISSIESIPVNVIISLCMQSPFETIKKLCHLVMASKAANLQIFQVLKPACEVLLPSGDTLLGHIIMCLLSEELTSAEEDYFLRFVVELRKENLLHSNFLENLIKGLKELLEKSEMNKAVLCLSIIDNILIETKPVNKIAFLVFISQVLGHFSWDLRTFSIMKANGRDIVCSIVDKLMTRLDLNTDRDVLNRAREEILKCWEVNQACFCDLWFRFGKTWHGSGKFDSLILALIHSSCSLGDLRKFLLTFGPPNEVRISIVLALTKVLPVLTLNFWNKALSELTRVWAEMNPSEGSSIGYEVFQMFVWAWYVLTLQLNIDSDIQSCYKHCMAGFGRLFFSAHLEGEPLVRTYEMILFIVKSIESEEIRKSCYVTLLPVLKDRLASSSQKGTKAHFEKIEKILSEEFKN